MSNDIDVELMAAALGVDPTTLPSFAMMERVTHDTRVPAIAFEQLSDDEWGFVVRALPALPVAKPNVDYRNRDFIDATIWWLAASKKGIGWAKLPERYWPISSREHRHRRWCQLGWWTRLFDSLTEQGSLSSSRLATFAAIARDAEQRRDRHAAARERLTGAR